MSAKLDNIIVEAVKFRKAWEKYGKLTTRKTSGKNDPSPDKLFKAIDDANLVPGEAELAFVLNPKDLVAFPTINFWLLKAEAAGAKGHTLEEVRQKMHAINTWQRDVANMRHVKVPT